MHFEKLKKKKKGDHCWNLLLKPYACHLVFILMVIVSVFCGRSEGLGDTLHATLQGKVERDFVFKGGRVFSCYMVVTDFTIIIVMCIKYPEQCRCMVMGL